MTRAAVATQTAVAAAARLAEEVAADAAAAADADLPGAEQIIPDAEAAGRATPRQPPVPHC